VESILSRRPRDRPGPGLLGSPAPHVRPARPSRGCSPRNSLVGPPCPVDLGALGLPETWSPVCVGGPLFVVSPCSKRFRKTPGLAPPRPRGIPRPRTPAPPPRRKVGPREGPGARRPARPRKCRLVHHRSRLVRPGLSRSPVLTRRPSPACTLREAGPPPGAPWQKRSNAGSERDGQKKSPRPGPPPAAGCPPPHQQRKQPSPASQRCALRHESYLHR